VEPHVLAVLRRARKYVFQMIGMPPDDLDGRFGPGTAVGLRSGHTTIPDKLSASPTLTHNAWWHLFHWSWNGWARAVCSVGVKPVFVRGNEYFTVPKDSSSLRACGKEALINGYYQLACGTALRRNYKRRYGVDLDYLQQHHREMACRGSRDDSIVTIDMTSASDTVCINLVKLMLPNDWYELLSSLRSPFTLVEGKWIRLEKFSSMGNGFTFELMTIILHALCLAACDGLDVGGRDLCARQDVSVFGDDIIVPREKAQDVLSLLRFVGFTPNLKKTFLQGHFRESCGGDFFDGADVRPFLLEELPTEPAHFIALANGIIASSASWARRVSN